MGIYYEKIDYMGFTWGFIWGMGFYMGKPHVIKICMEIYHTILYGDFPYKLHRHRSCIRWAIDVKMNFCKVLRCAFENNVVSSENTRSAAADDGCRRTRISTRHRHALYFSISSLANNARMSQARADTRSARTLRTRVGQNVKIGQKVMEAGNAVNRGYYSRL